MGQLMDRRQVQRLAVGTGVVLVYLCAGTIGRALQFPDVGIAPLRPTAGFALAALVLLGLRYWPAVLLGAATVHLLRDRDLGPVLILAIADAAHALLGAWLTRRLAGGASAFERVGGAFQFTLLAAVPGTVVAAALGLAAWPLAQASPATGNLSSWLMEWTGALVSDLVVAPFLIVWLSTRVPRIRLLDTFEAGAMLLSLLLISTLIFGRWNLLGGPASMLAFLAVPVMLWASFRFQQRGATTAVVVMSALAVAGTVGGAGPFAVGDPENAIVLLQTFMGVHALTLLVMGAMASQRTRVSASLGRNVQRLRLALDAGHMAAWEWDADSGTVRWSPGMELIHGLPPGTPQTSVDALLTHLHPEDRHRITHGLCEFLEQNAVDHRVEYRLMLPTGETRWVEARGRMIRDLLGRPWRMIGVCMDITDQKRMQYERELLLQRERGARAEAERANRSKDQFLAVLSHELRTPLTPVLLTASLIESDPELPHRLRSDVLSIRRNVELEARLIDDLLDLTRIARGKLQLETKLVDLHEIVRRAIEISCGDASVEIATDLAAVSHHVRADAGRIQQVFWNLLTNARKFTPAGGRIIVTSRNGPDGDRSIIVVDVDDTGVGIDPEMLPKLFNAFEQGGSEHARRAGGLGLGLAICKALVLAHGGNLTASSPGIGQGSTFTVQLQTTPAPIHAAPPRPAATTPGGRSTSPARPVRILLVEDDAGTLGAMQRLLNSHRHQVLPATSVASAMEVASQHSVDLVISDLGLPDGLGYELMRTLADKYGLCGIALSGYGMAADIDRSHDAGFIEHLVKPVDIAAVEAAIARALSMIDRKRRAEPAADDEHSPAC